MQSQIIKKQNSSKNELSNEEKSTCNKSSYILDMKDAT